MPEWTDRYGYGGIADYQLRPGRRAIMRPGAAMRAFPGVPDVIIDGEIVESDPPRELVQAWRMQMDPAPETEGFTRLTHEIESSGGGGGWAGVLSDLKTLLEPGSALAS